MPALILSKAVGSGLVWSGLACVGLVWAGFNPILTSVAPNDRSRQAPLTRATLNSSLGFLSAGKFVEFIKFS